MSKKHLSKNKPRPYAPEFRRQMVELVRAGRTPEQLATGYSGSSNNAKELQVCLCQLMVVEHRGHLL